MAVPDYTKQQLARYLTPGGDGAVRKPLDLRNLSSVGKGWEAFKDETAAIGGGALALGAQHLKNILPEAAAPYIDPIVKGGFKYYQDQMAESVAGAQAPTEAEADITKAKSLSDVGDWIGYQGAKGLPQLAGFGLGGLAGRQLARFGVKKATKEAIKGQVGKAGLTQEVKDAAKAEMLKRLETGTIAGGVGMAAPYEGGAAFGEMLSEGVSPEKALAPATGVAGINAALEFLPIYKVFDAVGAGNFAKVGIRETIKKDKELGKAAVELARRVSGAGATGATAEGLTEGLQELTNIAAMRWAQDEDLFADLSEEQRAQVINASLAGGMLGGGVAGAGGAFVGPRPTTAPPPPGQVGPPAPESTTQPPGQPPGADQTGYFDEEGNFKPFAPAEGQPGFVGPVWPEAERRKDDAVRKAIDKMEGAEKDAAIDYLRKQRWMSEATGISNRIAWQEREKKPWQAMLDVDSLKWKNDNQGHEAGDELLKHVAKALQDATGDAFHMSGDEFTAQGDSYQELQANIELAREVLGKTNLGGYAPSFSYGIGQTTQEAESNMMLDKQKREQQGLRAARGEEPPRFGEVPSRPPQREFRFEFNEDEIAPVQPEETLPPLSVEPTAAAPTAVETPAAPEVQAGPTITPEEAGPSPKPVKVGKVQLPINLIQEGAVPPSLRIQLTKQTKGQTERKQVNAQRAVKLAKGRVDALVEAIKCLR